MVSMRTRRKVSMSCRSGGTKILLAKIVSEFSMVVKQIIFRGELQIG